MKKSFQKSKQRREDGKAYKHDLGQHFLYDENLLRTLVAGTGVTPQDGVLEIGPGSGALTSCLCDAARHVLAVEADSGLLPFLRIKLATYPNITIIEGDIRKQPLEELCLPLGKDFFVIANIPYNITTPILDLLWHSRLPIRQASVMVQKEVADKLLASPSDDAYGLLSVKCAYYCEPALVALVPAEAFTPPPKVDSAFINLPFRKEPPLPVQNETLLFSLIKAGFGMRRKTLANAVKGVLPLPTADVHAILQQLHFSPFIRGEALSIEDWIRFANACHEHKRCLR